MRLRINNISKIKATENIEFDGITVIAGANNTGKSTISKVLYCIFTTLYRIDKQIIDLRKNDTLDYINNILGFDIFSDEDIDNIYQSIIVDKDIVKCRNILNSLSNNNDNISELIEEFIKKIETNILNIKDDEYKNRIATKHFNNEFIGQCSSILNDENGTANLIIKNTDLNFALNNDNELIINDKQFKILHKVFYYDGPNLIDNNANRSVFPFVRMLRHNNHQSDFYNSIKLDKDMSNERISNKKKANEIFNKYFNTEKDFPELEIKFRNKINKFDGVTIKGAKEQLRVERLSSGLKTISALYNLFCNAIIDEDILILDEPEINLHPEWQVYLAELLIELRNKFNLTLLISTHSPYFINAINTYSFKYKIQNLCHYYMAKNIIENDVEYSVLNEILNIDDIYDSLAIPFERLLKDREALFNE